MTEPYIYRSLREVNESKIDGGARLLTYSRDEVIDSEREVRFRARAQTAACASNAYKDSCLNGTGMLDSYGAGER